MTFNILDLLGRNTDPDSTFLLRDFDDLEDNSTYKANDDGPGFMFNVGVSYTYTNGCKSTTSKYFEINNIYFEAIAIITKEGVLVENHKIIG